MLTMISTSTRTITRTPCSVLFASIRHRTTRTTTTRQLHSNTTRYATTSWNSYTDTSSQKFSTSTPTSTSTSVNTSTLAFHEKQHQQPEHHRACNEQQKGVLVIKECRENKGLGLFASRDFQPGDLVMSATPVFVGTERSSHSVQVDRTTHVLMNLPAVLINHSCDANVGIRNNQNYNATVDNDIDEQAQSVGAYDFFALRPIPKDRELTWDYEASEWELCTPFECGCGSQQCRGTLSGFKHNGDTIRERYGDYHADYLKQGNGAECE